MAEQNTPNLSLSFRYTLGESGWNTGYDTNWRLLEMLLQGNVLSASTTAEPGSPNDGDLYIVPASATGTDWAGEDEKLAYYDGSASGGADEWVFVTPLEGMRFFAADESQPYLFDGTNWDYEANYYGSYADDTAASGGSVPIGGWYINSSTGALTKRLS
jgi:hypothetical protein